MLKKLVSICTSLILSLSLLSPSVQAASPPSLSNHKIHPDVLNAKSTQTTVLIETHTALDSHSLDQLKKKVPSLKVKEIFSTVFSGLSITLNTKDISLLSSFTHVKHVYPIRKYKKLTKESVPLIGAPAAWEQLDTQSTPITGKGIKVGVIDTGIDSNHPGFGDSKPTSYDVIAQKRSKKPTDTDGHGTHVAGIIHKVAPGATLVGYKVFDDNGICTNENLIKGIERAVKDKVQVINVSLGANFNIPDEPIITALNTAVKKGVTVVVAAGNAGSNRWSVGTPAAAASVITVGASTKKTQRPAIQINGEQPMEIIPIEKSPRFRITYPCHIIDVGTGEEEGSFAKAKGKVVLVERGKTSIKKITQSADKAGALAIIIYNNQSKEWVYEPIIESFEDLFFPFSPVIPVATIAGKYGQHIKEKIASGSSLIEFTSVLREGIAPFSSRGPVVGTWEMKPDIVAPGAKIRSFVPKSVEESGFAEWSGTSMSSPHVAGAAALIKQKHPTWTPAEIKSALSNTACPLADSTGKRDGYMDQGSGRIDILKALNTESLALPNHLNFGMIQPNTDTKTITKRFRLKNMGTSKKTYSLRFRLNTKEKNIHLTFPKNITVKESDTESIPVKISVDTKNTPRGIYTGALLIKDGTNQLCLPFSFMIEPKNYLRIDGLSIEKKEDEKNTFTISYYLPVSPQTFELKAVNDNGKEYLISGVNDCKVGYTEFIWKGKTATGKLVGDGNYTLVAKVKYLGKKTEISSDYFTIDRKPPKIVVEPTKKKGVLTGFVIDETTGVESIRWRLDGSKEWNDLDLTPTASGAYRFKYTFSFDELKKEDTIIVLQAKDETGNVSTIKVPFHFPKKI